MNNQIAQAPIQIAPNQGFVGFGPLGTNVGTGIDIFARFVSTVVGLMTLVAFIWFVFVFFIGAIGIINAGGDKQALETARKKITTGVMGLVATIAAIFIVNLIGRIFGLDILNIVNLFTQIQL